MEWEGREESSNVEDRRGMGAKVGIAAGGGGLIVLILALILNVDPQQLAQVIPQGQQQQSDTPRAKDPAEEKVAKFSKVIFHDTEVVWGKLFRDVGKKYREPKLVLYTGRTESACGLGEAAMGPFYCPGDEKVYIDLAFYQDMQRKLNAPGEFARAYVIAHEVGHHVQKLLGYSKRVDEIRRTGSKVEANHASVRLELQADYLAGVWAHHGQEQFKFLQKGDIESAMNAANQIGDDRLQKRARGVVVPDAFTHGTSQQRMRWFRAGFDSGSVSGAAQLFKLPYGDL
ncbi:MAG: neutral zinc metallopeptidase [Planctomycetes bacterium]|nr:neutral zinc metallopeptidase [Planctomycetota bacterium]